MPQATEVGSLNDLRNVAAVRQKDLRPLFPGELESVFVGAAIEQARWDSSPFGPFDGVVQDATVLDWVAGRFGENHLFSVDQIEGYLGCPFRFFAMRVLGAEPVEEPTEDVEAAERGQIVHAVLQEFHAGHAGRAVADLEPVEAACSMRAALDSVMQDRLMSTSKRVRGFWEAEKGALRRLLDRYLRWERAKSDSRWKPVHFEVSFGQVLEKSRDRLDRPEPFALNTAVGRLRFGGKIDRIDCLEEESAARVVDYKTGQPPTYKSMLRGESVQLPLYVLAVENHVQLPWPCVEARFVRVGHKPYRDVMQRHKEEEWAQCMSQSLERVAEVVQAIRQGRFPPTPAQDRCKYCPVQLACRFEQGRIERKQRASS